MKYYAVNRDRTVVSGPIDVETLRARVRAGQLAADDLLSSAVDNQPLIPGHLRVNDWFPARLVPGIGFEPPPPESSRTAVFLRSTRWQILMACYFIACGLGLLARPIIALNAPPPAAPVPDESRPPGEARGPLSRMTPGTLLQLVLGGSCLGHGIHLARLTARQTSGRNQTPSTGMTAPSSPPQPSPPASGLPLTGS